MVNASVTQVETVSIHGVDHIAAMCSEYLRASGLAGFFPQLMAKCWDLSAAYKQVPLSDAACHLDGYLVVYNPQTQSAEIYRQQVLPFGSIASVTAFLRCSLAIWHIGSTLLHFCWSSYFHDYLNICEQAETKHVDICISLLFQLLGWKLSEEKLVPYDVCCKVLGVELTLTSSPTGHFCLSNTEARRKELTAFLQETLGRGTLNKHEAERLRGRLQFASNQLFGRRFRNVLRDLNVHISRGFKAISPELQHSFEVLLNLLDTNRPRRVDVNFFAWQHMYVDASYGGDGHSGIGGLLLDDPGTCLNFFSEEVPRDVIYSIRRNDQDTIIFELEGLAIAVGLHVFKEQLRGKRLVVFTDNQAAEACLIKCKSANENMDLIIRFICTSEESLDMMSWIERVPSQSNPADILSREVVQTFLDRSRTKVEVAAMWRKCVSEMKTPSSHKRERRDGVKD